VGILIILIVIAGVRVSQTPVKSADSVAVDPPAVELVVADPHPDLSEEPVTDCAVPVRSVPSRAPKEPEPIEQPPLAESPPLARELVDTVTDLEQQLEQLRSRRQTLTTEVESAVTLSDRARQERDAATRAAEEARAAWERGKQALEKQEQTLSAKQQVLATLQVTLAETEAEQPPTTVLKHKLTPVGRKVEGKEVHFLLSGGRVAVVPIDELGEELKRQLERRRDDVLRTERYVGSVGPLQGFRMEYVVERLPTSLIDDLRRGQAVIRSGLTEFQIRPQPGMITETAEQALHPHGRFLAALRHAGPDATLTFWVYPDSFALHRELQEFVHDQGFEVAARPLPFGIPITGSPQGSRSVAQ
ncbi:MAG: hypothetical protein KF861_16895, partial [Planctomycetaceae bacterium]|nr:hypothetical protein [Planctomycetaceae bacterium]